MFNYYSKENRTRFETAVNFPFPRELRAPWNIICCGYTIFVKLVKFFQYPWFCKNYRSSVLEHTKAQLSVQTWKVSTGCIYTVNMLIESSCIWDQYHQAEILRHLRCAILQDKSMVLLDTFTPRVCTCPDTRDT